MQLTIFNGSPRGTGGNSELLIQWLVEGVRQNPDINIDILYLNKIGDHENFVNKFKIAESVLIVFPLYTDSMPGIVMAFFEKLQPLRKYMTGLRLGFVVHSGFPEALQSRYVEKYLVWLADELGADYFGTVVMGGSEGISMMPPGMIKKKRALFNELGRRLPEVDIFDAALVRKIAGMEKLGKFRAWCLRIVAKTGIINIYMNNKLKENNAFEERFAKPYAK